MKISRLAHVYSPGDLILIINPPSEVKRKLLPPTEGPYKVLKSSTNGTIRIQRDGYKETIHIRRIKPFKSSNMSAASKNPAHGGE